MLKCDSVFGGTVSKVFGAQTGHYQSAPQLSTVAVYSVPSSPTLGANQKGLFFIAVNWSIRSSRLILAALFNYFSSFSKRYTLSIILHYTFKKIMLYFVEWCIIIKRKTSATQTFLSSMRHRGCFVCKKILGYKPSVYLDQCPDTLRR